MSRLSNENATHAREQLYHDYLGRVGELSTLNFDFDACSPILNEALSIESYRAVPPHRPESPDGLTGSNSIDTPDKANATFVAGCYRHGDDDVDYLQWCRLPVRQQLVIISTWRPRPPEARPVMALART